MYIVQSTHYDCIHYTEMYTKHTMNGMYTKMYIVHTVNGMYTEMYIVHIMNGMHIYRNVTYTVYTL